jgi:hypothetical protein
MPEAWSMEEKTRYYNRDYYRIMKKYEIILYKKFLEI